MCALLGLKSADRFLRVKNTCRVDFSSHISRYTSVMYTLCFSQNQTVSQRSMHFSVVGTLLIMFSIFRKPHSHLFADKIPSILQSSAHKPLIHISFLILPTEYDIYLSWALKSTLYVPLLWHLAHSALCFGICDLDFFPLQGSWRAGTMSSLFLELLKVKAPISSKRFLAKTKGKKGIA